MDKWEALKKLLDSMGVEQRLYVGHLLAIMEELENNPNWDLKKDGFTVSKRD